MNDTFGSSFQRLLEPDFIPLFAKVLYSGLFVSDDDKALGLMNPWGVTHFANDSTQHQLWFIKMLRFAATRLPELAELEKYGVDHASEFDSLDLERAEMLSSLDDASNDSVSYYMRMTSEFSRRSRGFSTALMNACSCGRCKVVDQNSASKIQGLRSKFSVYNKNCNCSL